MRINRVLSHACVLLLAINAQAQFTYTTNSNHTINITGYSGTTSTLTIPSTINSLPVTTVDADAFENDSTTGFTSAVIPNSVGSIGDDAFFNSTLTSITIGSGLTNIGLTVFGYCKLTSITVDASNPAFSASGNVLFNKNQTVLFQYPIGVAGPYVIPNTVLSIFPLAFAGCNLGAITIPVNVTNIGFEAFDGASLTGFGVDAANPAFAAIGGVLFSKDLTTLIQYPIEVVGPYNVPDSVTTIGDSAFSEAEGLTSINFGTSVKNIGYDAFLDCFSLTRLTVPDSVTNIDVYAFYSSGITRAIIGKNVVNLGYAAFDACGGLQEIYFCGNAPALSSFGVFADDTATVYYPLGGTGWGTTFGGLSTSAYFAGDVVKSAAAGLYHSLFIKMDGTLWDMGENGFGQLGIGTTSNANQIHLVASNVVAAAGGGFHTLFVKTNGSLWVMGDNQYGELGDGRADATNRPEMIVPSGVVAVAAGVYHSLFLKSDSSLWGMGYNHDGQLGDGSSGPANQTNRPEYIDTNVMAIAAGNYHSMYIKNGGVWLMGYNDNGQLGTGGTSSIFSHTEVIRAATDIAARGNHSLYLYGENLSGMGDNSQGELGDSTYNNSLSPELIQVSVDTFAAGSDHTLYTQSNRSLQGTGGNAAGQLGDGTFTTTNEVETIVPASVVAVAAGDQHSLFITADGGLWGMGNNGGGELGDGTFNNTNRPEQIAGPTVANGGFEMGNFDGWDLTVPGHSVGLISGSHTGSYAAQFGNIFLGGFGGSTESVISQTVTTQPGANYLLSFWVEGLADSSASISWNGVTLAVQSYSAGWTNEQLVVTATSTNAILQFTFPGIFNHQTTTTALDDVSLAMLPPTVTEQRGTGSKVSLASVGHAYADYALDRSFNLTPPVTWTPQLTNFTDQSGLLSFTNTALTTTNNFWRLRYVP